MAKGDKASTIVAGSEQKKKRLPSKRLFVVTGAAALCVVLGLFGYWWSDRSINQTNSISQNALEKAYENAKSNQPNTDVAHTKAAYLLDLSGKAAMAGDYKGAIDALQTRRTTLRNNVPLTDYLSLATYYCRLDMQNEAISTLDEAVRLPKATEDERAHLTHIKEEINKQGCRSWTQQFDQE